LKSYETTEAAVEATEPLVDTHAEADAQDVEGLRVRLIALNEVLEQTREDAIASKHQLTRFQRQHQNYLEKHELQIQTLNR
jgi:sorting nexin-29